MPTKRRRSRPAQYRAHGIVAKGKILTGRLPGFLTGPERRHLRGPPQTPAAGEWFRKKCRSVASAPPHGDVTGIPPMAFAQRKTRPARKSRAGRRIFHRKYQKSSFTNITDNRGWIIAASASVTDWQPTRTAAIAAHRSVSRARGRKSVRSIPGGDALRIRRRVQSRFLPRITPNASAVWRSRAGARPACRGWPCRARPSAARRRSARRPLRPARRTRRSRRRS